jgi:hypothetical protein
MTSKTPSESKPKWVDKKYFGLLTVDQIRTQIEIREELIKQMVGTLYPEILTDEIKQLKELLQPK